MEEFSIYRDYQKACAYQEQQRNSHDERLKNADAETLEGYIHFGGGVEVKEFEAENEDLKF